MQRKEFVDLEGLAPYEDYEVQHAVARALCPNAEVITNRWLLAQLVEGSGVTVITGPSGIAWWSLVSPEVKVKIEPDGYEYEERVGVFEWALRNSGASSGDAKRLSQRDTPPSRGQWVEVWARAVSLQQTLLDLNPIPLVIDDLNVELTGRISVEGLTALDFEWNKESAEAYGLSGATSTHTLYEKAPYAVLRSEIQETMRDSGDLTIWHGARADLGTQLVNVRDIKSPHDTMIMAYLAGEPRLGLKPLTTKYLHRDPTPYWKGVESAPVAAQARYAGADARNTYDLFFELAKTLVEREQWGVYNDIERPVIPVIVEMEQQGVPVDIDVVKRLYRDTAAVEQGVRRAVIDNYGVDLKDDGATLRWLTQVLGHNPGTLDQRTLTMYPQGEVDLTLLYRRSRTRRRSFLGRALRYWSLSKLPSSSHKPKVIRRLLNTPKKRESFARWETSQRAANASGFRFYPRFNQAGRVDDTDRGAARSGRLTSTDPNLQNQDRGVREMYVPPERCLWWSYDWTGLELSIAAALSGDQAMIETLMELDSQVCSVCKTTPPVSGGICLCGKKLGDLHGTFQLVLAGITGQMFDRTSLVKPANFEQLYRGGAKKLQEIIAKSRTFVSLETCEALVEGHKVAFPGYDAYVGRAVAGARSRGYSETLFGRRRYLLWDGDDPTHDDRAALNHGIQGTAADIAKKAMAGAFDIVQRYDGGHLALQVHDELDGFIKETADVGGFMEEMKEMMESFELPNGVRLHVDGGVGKNWAESH